MSQSRQFAVDSLISQGFVVTEKLASATRMARGADMRIVMCDGTVKRAQHQGRGYQGIK